MTSSVAHDRPEVLHFHPGRADVGGTPPIPIPTHDPQVAVVYMINYYRQQAGLPPVSIDPRLQAAAAWLMADQARTLGWGHNGSDGSSAFQRMTRAGFAWTNAGEIAAAGFPGYLTVTRAWMDSSGHRAIILGKYKFAGSAATIASDGSTRWVVDFAS